MKHKYKVGTKKPKYDDAPLAVEDYKRSVCIPADDELLGMLDIDDEVTITISGRVSGMRNNVSDDYTDRDFTIEIDSVSIGDGDEDDAFGMGFGNGLIRNI